VKIGKRGKKGQKWDTNVKEYVGGGNDEKCKGTRVTADTATDNKGETL